MNLLFRTGVTAKQAGTADAGVRRGSSTGRRYHRKMPEVVMVDAVHASTAAATVGGPRPVRTRRPTAPVPAEVISDPLCGATGIVRPGQEPYERERTGGRPEEHVLRRRAGYRNLGSRAD